MNNTIAVEQNPIELAGSGIHRGVLIAVFVLMGVILLALANRYLRRHHKAGHRRRF